MLTKQIFISRDVSFHEHIFPFISSITSPQASISFPHICPTVATPVDATFLDPVLPPSHPSPSPCNPTLVSHHAVDSVVPEPAISDSGHSTFVESVPIPLVAQNPITDPHNVIPVSVVPEQAISNSGHSTFVESVLIPLVAQNPINDPPASIPSLRRSSRPSKTPTYLKE